MPANTAIISEGNESSSDEENPTPLSLQKHRDSILDFQQFVTRCKCTTTPNHDELESSLHSLPPMVILDVDDNDETESSLPSSGSFNLEMVPESDDQSLDPFLSDPA
jgi:hypothetical protein